MKKWILKSWKSIGYKDCMKKLAEYSIIESNIRFFEKRNKMQEENEKS